MDTIGISEALLAALMAQARTADPEECCGLLLGFGDRVEAVSPAGNVHPTPATHFEIDPQVLVDAHRAARASGSPVFGYFHSHPRGPAVPSATDRAMAAGDGRVWAIIGQGEITFWRDEPGGFAPLTRA